MPHANPITIDNRIRPKYTVFRLAICIFWSMGRRLSSSADIGSFTRTQEKEGEGERERVKQRKFPSFWENKFGLFFLNCKIDMIFYFFLVQNKCTSHLMISSSHIFVRGRVKDSLQLREWALESFVHLSKCVLNGLWEDEKERKQGEKQGERTVDLLLLLHFLSDLFVDFISLPHIVNSFHFIQLMCQSKYGLSRRDLKENEQRNKEEKKGF